MKGKSHNLGSEGQETDLKPQFALPRANYGAEVKLKTFTVSFKVDAIITAPEIGEFKTTIPLDLKSPQVLGNLEES